MTESSPAGAGVIARTKSERLFEGYLRAHGYTAFEFEPEMAGTIQGLSKVVDAETTDGLADLLQSLQNQYDLWFDKTAFFKMFEDSRGTNWGRQQQTMTFELPLPMPVPQPPARP